MGLGSIFGAAVATLRGNLDDMRAGYGPPTVLTAGLVFRTDGASVRFYLTPGLTRASIRVADEAQGDGQPIEWEVPFREFDLGSDGETPGDFPMPESIAEDIRYRLALEGVPPRRPLWLKLARPYGMLGALPWERELGTSLDRPVLRLPDFPQRPGARADILENALIVDPDDGAEPADVQRRVGIIIDAIIGGSSRSVTRIHVFPNGACFDYLQNFGSLPNVTVYDPAAADERSSAVSTADDAVPPPAGEPAAAETISRPNDLSPSSALWSRWIARSTEQRGLDAVHFICRARAVEEGAIAVFSSMPFRHAKDVPVVAIDLAELDLLLTRAGAWAATFVPADDACRKASAFVADGLAHVRAGAVLYMPLGPAGEHAVLEAFKLLFSASQSPVPELKEGFVYCHPDFITGRVAAPTAGELFHVVTAQAALLAQRTPFYQRAVAAITQVLPGVATIEPPAPPNWLGATQRLLESSVLEEMRRCGPDVLLSRPPSTPDPSSELSIEVKPQTIEILADIQAVVGDYLAKERHS